MVPIVFGASMSDLLSAALTMLATVKSGATRGNGASAPRTHRATTKPKKKRSRGIWQHSSEQASKVSGISRHARVDLQAPAVNASRHALAGVHSLLAQPVDHIQTAHSVMAEDDESGVVGLGIQARELGRHGSHGDQFGAF